jgi:hypothetical protein
MTMEHAQTVRLLKSKQRPGDYTTHISDTNGYPLCKTPIKLSLWEYVAFDPRERMRVCVRCRRLQKAHEST